MTKPNFYECHPIVTWQPNLAGHKQRESKMLSKNVFKQLEERTIAIKQEIFNKKSTTESKI